MGLEPATERLGHYFSKVLERYGYARQNIDFGGHHEIYQYFDSIKRGLESSPPVTQRPFLRVAASYGKGNWATIPWVSLLDSRETTSTQRGTYVVYLFREDGAGFYIKLAQGVTTAERELGARAYDVLAAQADRIRAEVLELGARGFDLTGKSDLGTTHKKGKLYEASTIASKYYPRDAIPSDETLLADLEAMLAAYEHVVKSGATAPEEASRALALVGTWKTVKNDIDGVAEFIQHRGGWASPWSFRLKDGAISQLKAPFTLYVNGGGGQIVARARVSAFARADDSNGTSTPWPDVTEQRYATVSRFGPGSHEAIKTWFRISAIELVTPFRATELDLAPGLSTPENLLNQNAFGYVYEKDDVEVGTSVTTQDLRDVSPEAPPPDFEWLVENTLLEAAALEEMTQSLSSASPQIVLAGPPGTSKTWVAKKLAEFITGGRRGAVSTVQFHPSYTYESFMEGLRPKASASGVSFELLPGAVLQLVDVMRKAGHLNDSRHPYVLIMDEANRANLPRVLGELLFLFEYRNEGIRLQYSGEFKLPSNLYFIATMNTADRSIRSIDAALRRRFDIFELGPNSEALARYYQKTGQNLPAVVDGLAALNAALKDDIDRHHTIGHSFFMQSEMNGTRLRRVWERKIYPLLEEYFFDQPDLVSDYTYQRFWPDVA